MAGLAAQATEPIDDPQLLAYIGHCVGVHEVEFWFYRQTRPPMFTARWSSERSQFAPHVPGLGPVLFLACEGDPLNRLIDAGHEVFHWYITLPKSHPHWTQEMAAVHMSLACLYATGDPCLAKCATVEAQWFREQAWRCKPGDMLKRKR